MTANKTRTLLLAQTEKTEIYVMYAACSRICIILQLCSIPKDFTPFELNSISVQPY